MTSAAPRVPLTGDEPPQEPEPPSAVTAGLARLGLVTWAGIGVLAAAALLARLVNLGAHLPGLASGDEQVMVGRTQELVDGHLTALYDWPTGAFMLLAPVYRWGGLVVHDLGVPDSGARYLAARALVALAGTALVLVTALLAAGLVPGRRARRTAAWVAGAAVAFGYTVLEASRVAHPEVLQDTAAAAALLMTLRLARDPRFRWAILAGALAGAAAGFKYVGGVALVVAVAAALLAPVPGRRRLALAGSAAAAAAVVFGLLVPAVVLDPSDLWAGLDEQVLHSVNGHVGADSATPALLVHVRDTLPGTLGLPLTLVVLVGLPWGVLRGGRAGRLVAAYCLVAAVPVGASHLTFPRYVIVVLPALCALGGALVAWCVDAASARLLPRVPAGASHAAALLLVAAALTPTTVDAARLVRAEGAPDTRVLAGRLVAGLPGPVYVENYAVPLGTPADRITGLDRRPDLGPGCRCYVVLSSFMEDRYRNEPGRYRLQVALYDRLRAAGRVVAVVAPSSPLDYRWEGLPGYGVRALGLSGGETVGPTVTIIRLD